jgi:lipoprotein NlpD
MIVRIKIYLLILMTLFVSGCSNYGYGRVRIGNISPTYRVVEQGDSISKIAAEFDMSVEQLANVNGFPKGDSLQPGHRLLISHYSVSPANKPSSSARGWYGGRRIPSGKSEISPSLPPQNVPPTVGTRLVWPVKGARLASRFGKRWGSFHDGLDFAAPTGTPIYSADNGVVAYSGNGLRGYGNLIVLKGDTGLTTVYAHNSKNFVKKGQRVNKGQHIAAVGSSGKSTGPHLHFETRMNKDGHMITVDPLPLLESPYGRRPLANVAYRVNNSLRALVSKLSW